ncbi:ATP-binding protein [Cellulomonas xiejunii]|uniref:ATP-binding protein n=1 Tax=Cellulomonas xiejunii TaxID=2968083 RepID=A0ABY5KU61_9CELL|nr:ATP-binding protein [Cellulomonas xiejunii]MCC2321938.1 ATP-binding protein [Cellulomonas xiejunii]UUI73239.1 ATP-binding protein [Cellulomonas xiejunii]
MSELPVSFDPLEFRPTGPNEMSAHARNIVKNVLDSYTGRFDVLAEAVQNAMDAIEARWGAGVDNAAGRRDGEYPTIRIEIDASARNEITVTDNGVGIAGDKLQEVFTPHLSPKLLYGRPTRGHKGVGTTFLIYGHPAFEVRTKTTSGEVHAYRIQGGSEWVQGETILPAPKFERVEDAGRRLENFGSGTSITVKVDESTRFGRVRNAQYNKLETWELVLRTFTAIGIVNVGIADHRRPEWVRELRVELELLGVSGGGTCTVVPKFHFPHSDAATSVSLSELWSGSVSDSNRYEMLYLELGPDALEQQLKAQIEELENSDSAEDQETLQTLRKYETSVYASWAYKNTLYEDLYRGALEEPSAKRFQYMNVRGGLMVASVGMPIGETTDHPYATMKPEYRRRLFMIASFNGKYSPDLGRKTIPAQDRAFLEWLERQIQNLFLRYIGRLVRSNDEAPHHAGGFAQAKEELASEGDRVRKRTEKLQAMSEPLGFAYEPRYEAELVGIFYALLASGDLRGYRLLAVPGSTTRLDGYFDFEASQFAKPTPDDLAPLGIAESKATGGAFQRRGKWLEFKVRLDDLIDDFEAEDATGSKKYFDLVDLVVAWEVPAGESIGDYDLVELKEGNWNERDYYGATHLLRKSGGNHVVQVLALQDFIRRMQSVAPATA